jgi:hypothetical protein
VLDQHSLDVSLRHRSSSGRFSHEDALGPRRGVVERTRIDQPVVHYHLSPLKTADRTYRHELRITGPRSNQ